MHGVVKKKISAVKILEILTALYLEFGKISRRDNYSAAASVRCCSVFS